MRRRVERKEYNWYAIPEYCHSNGNLLTIFSLIVCIRLGDFFVTACLSQLGKSKFDNHY